MSLRCDFYFLRSPSSQHTTKPTGWHDRRRTDWHYSVNTQLDLTEFNLETMVSEWSVRTRIITASSSLFEKTKNSSEAALSFLQVDSVSSVPSECWSTVKTFHIKRYFRMRDLIQSNEVIWPTAKITFVSIHWIYFQVLFCVTCKYSFRTSVMFRLHWNFL